MAIHEGITYSRQIRFDVEKDLLCDRIDLEDSDSSAKTAYLLCGKASLIGEFVVSDEAKKDILRDAARSFERLCSGEKATPDLMDGRVLAVACVLLSQSSAGESDEQNLQDSGNTWQPILDGLNFDRISEKTGCSKQTARNRLCRILEDPSNIRFFTENGQRFYNTLRLHSLSPVWSIHNLYDILYSFYHKNLECSYDPDSRVAALFTSGIRRRWDNDVSAEDQKLRSDQLASGLRELFVLRPNYMSAVCDALLERIDHIVQGDFTLLDSKNRWDKLLLDWYRNKTEYEKKEMQKARKAAVKKKVVDKKESIQPEFVFEDGSISLCIPGIRLPEIQERPVVKLYQSDRLVYEQKLSVYGDVVLRTTRSHRIPLEQVQEINWNQPFCFTIHIDSGANRIYQSESKLYRDYFCFTPAGNETRLIRCNQMLRLITKESAELLLDDPEEHWREDAAPYRSISLWPESVRSVLLNGQEILQDNNTKQQRIWAYLTPESVSAVAAKIGTEAVAIYTEQPMLHVVVQNRTDAKNNQLIIDGKTEQLFGLPWTEGQFQVLLPQKAGLCHLVLLKDFEKGTIIFRRAYVIIPGFSYKFSEPYYPDTDCSGSLLVKTKKAESAYPFDLPPGEDAVAWEMGDIQLETAAPRLRAEINGMNAFYLPEMIWYEKLRYSFLSMHTPRDIQCSVVFGGKVMSPNHLGNYEVGTEIDRRNPSEENTVLGLLVRSGDGLQQQKLTEIRYTETFRSNPVVQDGRKILWCPTEAGFIGAERTAVFRLELDNSLQEDPFTYRLTIQPGVIEKNFPCREGSYRYVLWLTERKKLFSSLPDTKLLEGEISVTDPPENRFANKYIILTHAYFYDPVTKCNTSAVMQRNGALIDHIQYKGMRETDRQMLPEYSGIMYFKASQGWQMFSNEDTERFEKINPVCFTVARNGFVSVYLEDDEQLMLNLKYLKQASGSGTVRIFSQKNELNRQEQSLYLGFAEQFRFIERDN